MLCFHVEYFLTKSNRTNYEIVRAWILKSNTIMLKKIQLLYNNHAILENARTYLLWDLSWKLKRLNNTSNLNGTPYNALHWECFEASSNVATITSQGLCTSSIKMSNSWNAWILGNHIASKQILHFSMNMHCLLLGNSDLWTGQNSDCAIRAIYGIRIGPRGSLVLPRSIEDWVYAACLKLWNYQKCFLICSVSIETWKK